MASKVDVTEVEIGQGGVSDCGPRLGLTGAWLRCGSWLEAVENAISPPVGLSGQCKNLALSPTGFPAPVEAAEAMEWALGRWNPLNVGIARRQDCWPFG